MFPAHVAEVAIASPDDTGRFRTAIGHTLNCWNSASGQRHQIVLIPAGGHRTTDAEPPVHSEESAQTVDRGDVFVAVFDPMRRDVVEVLGALQRAKRAGKLVLAWLIGESPSQGLSADDRSSLGDVTKRLTEEGIVPRYIGHGEVHLESRLQNAIAADLTDANLCQLTEGFVSAVATARQVTIYRTPVALLGQQIWAVTVVNHSTSLAVGLQVFVDAVDSEGNDLRNGAKRSTQAIAIADVFAKLRTGRWPDEHHPLRDRGGVLPAQRRVFLTSPTDILAAHNAMGFPRWLRPNQHASALYSLSPNASLRVRMQFEDAAGELWSRVNDAEPERVSSILPGRSEQRRTSFAGQ